jgi:RecA-family ATPase
VRSVFAAGGVGKTTLTLYEAVTLALGRPLYRFEPLAPCKTVIITAEDPREILVARLQLIMEGMNLSAIERKQVFERVRVWDVSSCQLRLCEVVNDAVDPHLENINLLGGWLLEFKPDLVVFDPCVSFGIGESRTNDGEQGIVTALRMLRNQLDCCVQVIHHTGKQNARDRTTDQYTGRGGSALPDGSRMVSVITSMNASEFQRETGQALLDGETAMLMSLPKLTYAPMQPPVIIRRKGYIFEYVPTHRKTPEEVVVEQEAGLLAYIRNEWGRGMKHNQTSLECLGLFDLPKLKLRQLLNGLVVKGELIKHEEGRHRFFEPIFAIEVKCPDEVPNELCK